jgi:hypothetical protein
LSLVVQVYKFPSPATEICYAFLRLPSPPALNEMDIKGASHAQTNLMVLVVLLTILIPSVLSTTKCYRTNGIVGTDDIQPCYNNLAPGAQSACCNLGKSPPDLCLAGGLCYRQDGTDGNFLIYAVGCTDQLGTDAACQQYCTSDGEIEMYSLNACNDGRWCCNNITTAETCCDPVTGAGAFLLDHVLSLDPAPSGTTTTAVSTVTVVHTATSSVEPDVCNTTHFTDGACPNRTTIIAGASVGAAIGGFCLASAIALYFIAKLKTSQREQRAAQPQSTGTPTMSLGLGTGWRHEMDTKRHRVGAVQDVPGVAYEVDSGRPAELD